MMNLIAGVFSRDGTPIERQLLLTMIEAVGHNQAERDDLWIHDFIGFGHRQLYATSETSSARQLQVDSTGTYWITFDGRIDNRQELIKCLDVQQKLANPSDAQLAILAYKAWGIDAVQKIIGDFAFGLWDSQNQTLMCATDVFGVRPLFYYQDGPLFVFASNISQLLQYGKVGGLLNENYVAEYLFGRISRLELTPFEGVFRLEPATVLLVMRNRLQKVCYWNLESQPLIRYKNKADYVERFRELFREAISCRLRSNGPICMELSGGIDSSSIVCMAQEIYREDGNSSHPFVTLSYVYDAPPTMAREQSFIDAVHRKYQIDNEKIIKIKGDEHWLLRGVPECFEEDLIWDEPDPTKVYHARTQDLLSELRKVDARVLISGTGGDHVVWVYKYYLADLLKSTRIKQLHSELKQWARLEDTSYFELLLNECVKPLFQSRFVSRRRFVPPWIETSWIKRIGFPQSLDKGQTKFLSIADQLHFERLMAVSPVESTVSTKFDVEVRYPFLHRSLVEYVMAIPWEVKVQPTALPKLILREAMKGILPEKVRQRPDKVANEHRVYRGVKEEWSKIQQLLQGMHLAALGYINVHTFEATLKLARQGYMLDSRALLPIIRTLNLEYWLTVGLGKEIN